MLVRQLIVSHPLSQLAASLPAQCNFCNNFKGHLELSPWSTIGMSLEYAPLTLRAKGVPKSVSQDFSNWFCSRRHGFLKYCHLIVMVLNCKTCKAICSCLYVILTTRIYILQSLSLVLLAQLIKYHPRICGKPWWKLCVAWIYFVDPKHIQMKKRHFFYSCSFAKSFPHETLYVSYRPDY